MRIIHIVGARPNFMKMAPVRAALGGCGKVSQTIVHTGQHYDENMSAFFFRELDIPEPEINLGVGSGSHGWQTGEVMKRFEAYLDDRDADIVLVYGDVNSTVAAALVSAKLGIVVGHVEAGLRSRDWTMPEEINRVVTDRLADLLFTPSPDADANLEVEGVPAERIHRVGNVMIDTLVRLLPRSEQATIIEELGLEVERYGLVTLHRPSNVDEPGVLESIMEVLDGIGRRIPLLFPAHPRTRERIERAGIDCKSVRFLKPLGYVDFLALQRCARFVLTDSGGVQEETTYLGIPCLTLRENTERPITVEVGTNRLVRADPDGLRCEVDAILDGRGKRGVIPDLWDGRAAKRIADVLLQR